MQSALTTALADDYAEIDRLFGDPSGHTTLSALLAEQSPLFKGRSSNQAARLRGYIFAGFEKTVLPDNVMSIVCEELESGIDPYVVSGAAKAIRGPTKSPLQFPAC